MGLYVNDFVFDWC